MRLIKRPYFNLVSVFSVRWGPNGRFWFLCSLERATKNINLTRRDRETSQLSPALSLLRIHWHEISVMTKFSYCEYSSQVRNAEGKVIMLCRKRRCEDLITQSLIATDVAASKRPWKSMYEANSGVRSCEARKIHLANGKGVWLCTLCWKVENISTSKNPGKVWQEAQDMSLYQVQPEENHGSTADVSWWGRLFESEFLLFVSTWMLLYRLCSTYLFPHIPLVLWWWHGSDHSSFIRRMLNEPRKSLPSVTLRSDQLNHTVCNVASMAGQTLIFPSQYSRIPKCRKTWTPTANRRLCLCWQIGLCRSCPSFWLGMNHTFRFRWFKHCWKHVG